MQAHDADESTIGDRRRKRPRGQVGHRPQRCRGVREIVCRLWWATAAWRFLRRGLGKNNASSPPAARPTASLGVDVGVEGPGAQAVFRDFAPAPRWLYTPRVDVVLADTSGAADADATPVATLAEHPALAVPAFDPAQFNPIGWVRDAGDRVATLGPPRLLPPGIAAHGRIRLTDGNIARCHHVEDIQTFHRSVAARAGALVRLAARGTPVRLADRSPALASLLGPALHALMADGVRDADAHARELLSVRLRRLALRDHTLRSRARQVCEAASIPAPPPTYVSVVLATRRPALLDHALTNVHRQDYPRLELVLALHGDGFDPDAVRRATGALSMPATVVTVGEHAPLGAVLQAASEAAAGTLIAKMDDDDVYDAGHVRDLVAAREYSGAELVGKFHEVVYLADEDCTVEIRRGTAERYGEHVSGAALLISRLDLEYVGGWRRIPRQEDVALIDDVTCGGGRVYKTHAVGLLRIRHGDRHAYRVTSGDYLRGATAVHRGWRPLLAGMDGAPRPPLPTRPAGA